MTYDDSDCLVLVDGNNGKACTRCKELKPLEAFSPSKIHRLGRHSWCKACIAQKNREYRAANREKFKARDREYYQKNKEKSRAYFRLRNYGITPEEYDKKVDEQGGGCFICGEKPTGTGNRSMLHVDHDHDSGQVRDLLCGNCNTSIGTIRENPETARKMADYLERWGK